MILYSKFDAKKKRLQNIFSLTFFHTINFLARIKWMPVRGAPRGGVLGVETTPF